MNDSTVTGACVAALCERLNSIHERREALADEMIARMHALDVEDETLRGMISAGLEQWRKQRLEETQYEDDLAAIREWEDGASPF